MPTVTDEYDRSRCAVAGSILLRVRDLGDCLRRRMVDLHSIDDAGPVVRDDQLSITNEQFVHAAGAEREVKDEIEPKEDAVFADEIDTSELTQREELAVRVADYTSRDPQDIPDEFFDELRKK